MGTSIGLNLGCGNKIYPSTDSLTWVNVDLEDNAYGVKPDVSTDLRKLPFDDDYADVIEAIHIFEHFHVYEADPVMREWKRVLKPGGTIVLELPCMNKIIECLQTKKAIEYTYCGLYGDARTGRPELDHHWCYSIGQMTALLEQVGFKDIQYQEPIYHLKERDMRFTARK